MRRFSGFLAFSVLLAACGGGGGGGGGGGNGPPPSEPTTYYVRASGSDDNDGKSPDTAFLNPAEAAKRLKPGDTIYIGPGTYTAAEPPASGASSPVIDVKDLEGTAELPTQVIADNNGTMTGDRAGAVIIDANNALIGIRVSSASYVVIDGFNIQRARGNNSAGIQIRSQSTNATVRNCVLVSNGDGIRVQNSSDALIFNNLIVGNSNRGLRIADGSQNVRVINNTVTENGNLGVYIGGANQDGVAATGATLQNNIVQDNGNVSIRVDEGPPTSLDDYAGDYNLVFFPNLMDQTKTYRPTTIIGENDINMDAVFWDPGNDDYHLDPEFSPAIDTGTANIDGALLTALFQRSTSPEGTPDGAPVDIGYHYPAVP